ncbi:hypothetical protein F5Y01DRAFT_211771 [Xylaria sp. FL0043]|nr:hypothetical protein F5Y01DRAFT_211771 [Xylaria sp. FL0043]
MLVKKKDGGGKSSIIRPFGNLECYEGHMIQLRFLGNNIVSCRYAIPAPLAEPGLHDQVIAHVEDAIARVVLEHPALRVDAVNLDTKRPAWVAVEQVNFAHHVQWVDITGAKGSDNNAVAKSEETLPEIIERRLDEPYENMAGRPRWRVLILFKNSGDPFLDIIFDYSHAFGDGTSGKIFHETLFRILNPPTAPVEAEIRTPILKDRILTIPPTAKTLPPPMEKAGKFSLSAKFAVSTAWKELRPLGLSSLSAAHAHWAPIRMTPYKTRFRAFDVPADALGGILAACRARKTTVTGLLHALLLVSLASRIPTQAAFAGSTALDLRRHLVGVDVKSYPGLDPQRTVANYVSAMTHEFDADVVRRIREEAAKTGDDAIAPAALVDLVWQCAARVRGEIQKRLDSGLRNDVVGLMKLIPDWRAQLRADAGKPRPHSFVVSNLGVLNGEPLLRDSTEEKKEEEKENRDGDAGSRSRWRIAYSTFAISAEVCGAAFQVSPISVRDGSLCMGCSWQDCVVNLKLGEAIVGDLERWLQFLAKT